MELLLAAGDVFAYRCGAPALHEQKHATGIGVESVIERRPIIVAPICGCVRQIKREFGLQVIL